MVVLSPLESVFLQLESPEAPMHMASIGIFEGAPLLDDDGELRLRDLRALIESRLHLVPKLRQRPRTGLFHQAPQRWSDDPAFDITQHVRQVRIPRPGNDAQLRKTCGRLLAELLPDGRPLWELIFLTGLHGGRVGLVEKLHHSVADGLAAAELATVLFDLEPTVAPHEPLPPWRPATSASTLGSALEDLSRLAAIALRVPLQLGEVAHHPVRSGCAALRFGKAVAPLPFRVLAPRSSLNVHISKARAVHMLRTDLDDVHRIAHEHRATINDVLLTLVSGGLRSLFSARGELAGLRELQALVPVGLAAREGRTTGNGVSCYLVRLPLFEGCPEQALSIISGETRAQKTRHEEIVPDVGLRLLDIVPQGLLGEGARLLRRQPFFNVIVTNVPGPPVPLYVLGARLLDAFPIVPLLGNQGLGVAAISYVDALEIGVFSNPDVCPDVATFCTGVTATLQGLVGSKVPTATEDRPWPSKVSARPNDGMTKGAPQ
jgi:diacylglycerol O-acyltransferase / wax synthase